MEHGQRSLEDVAMSLQASRETGQQSLLKQSITAGSPAKLLKVLTPLVGTGCPQDLSSDALIAETESWYLDSEKRLGMCAGCPPEGGACAADGGSSVRVGRKPTWVGQRLEAPKCERWREHLVRERLASSGVPKFFLDSTFQKFPRTLDKLEFGKFMAFVDGAIKHRAGFLLLTGKRESGKTRLSIATMRTLVRRAPRALLWYTDMTAVGGVMRQRYDENDTFGDHFGNAREADVTIVDNLEVRAPEWVHERLEALLRERWLARASTIVTTRGSVDDIARIYEKIPDFRTVTVCQLQ